MTNVLLTLAFDTADLNCMSVVIGNEVVEGVLQNRGLDIQLTKALLCCVQRQSGR